MSDTPNVARLREKFEALKASGLRDLKIWYVGGHDEGTTLESLAEEVLAIPDADERGDYIDISEKIR